MRADRTGGGNVAIGHPTGAGIVRAAGDDRLILAFLAAAIVPAGQAFTCKPTHVWDGDGPIWCAEGPRIRLAGIAARELDGTCRRGHPCPEASGIAARDALVRLLGGARGVSRDGHVLVDGPRLRCRSGGLDKYRRQLATCALAGRRDLGTALIERGVAVRWRYAAR